MSRERLVRNGERTKMLLRLIKIQPTAANVAVNLLKKVKKNVEKLLKILQKLFIIEEIVRFFCK